MRVFSGHFVVLLSAFFGLLQGCDQTHKCGSGRGPHCDHAALDSAPADTAGADTATAQADTAAAQGETDDAGSDPVPTPDGISVQSSKGNHNLWFDKPGATAAGQTASIQVTVHGQPGYPVTGLALAPKFIHVSMGHGGTKLPQAAEVGGGVYEVSNLVASMPGEWRLTVALPGGDSAALSWQVEK